GPVSVGRARRASTHWGQTPSCAVASVGSLALAEQGDDGERRRTREEQCIDAVEAAAGPGQQRPRVLDAEVALEERLEEVAEWRGQRHADTHEQRLGVREALAVERDPGREDAGGQADHEPLR